MIKTSLSILCVAVACLLHGFANAQMVYNHPSSHTITKTVEGSSIDSTINYPEYVYNYDMSSYLYLNATRTTGIADISKKNTLKVKYPISKGDVDNHIYFIYQSSDGISDYMGYHERTMASLGGSFYRLYNGSTLITESQVTIFDMLTIDSFNLVKLKTSQPVTHIEFETRSATTGSADRWLKIFSVFSLNGTSTIEDCGSPIAGQFIGKLDGLMLSDVLIHPKISRVFDNNPNTYVTDFIGGLLAIGAPRWEHYVQFLGLSKGTNTVRATIGKTGQSISLSAVRYKFEFYRNGELVDQTAFKTLQILGLLGINDYAKMDVYASTSQRWDMVCLVVDEPGISVTGGTLRIYEISRSIEGPSLLSGTAVFVPEGMPADITIKGQANEFLWYKTMKFYNPEIGDYDYTMDTSASAIIGSTAGSYLDGENYVTTFTTDPIFTDTIFMVRAVRTSCTNDTSVANKMYVKLAGPLSLVNKVTLELSSQENEAHLTWKNIQEQHIDYYILEKSHNASDWNPIHVTTAAGIPILYHYNDAQLQQINYYRIAIHHTNGDISYSNTVKHHQDELISISIIPNPANHYIQVLAPANTPYYIYDASGRMVLQGMTTHSSTEISTTSLQNGNYFFKLISSIPQQAQFTILK